MSRDDHLPILTKEVAQEALELVKAMFECNWESWGFNRLGVKVYVVLGNTNDPLYFVRGEIGEPTNDYPFARIAESKATMAFKERMDTGVLLVSKPHLLRDGDTIYRGGVFGDGFSVGVSGVQDFMDELIARFLRDTIRALCSKLLKEAEDADQNFILQDP